MEERAQIGTAASAGRIGIVLAALATFVTLFSAHIFMSYTRVDIIALFAVLIAAGCGIASLVAPRRHFDVVALACGACLIGFITPIWAEPYSSSTMAVLAWLLLVISCSGLAVGLSTGPPSVDPRAAAVMAGAADRMRQAGVAAGASVPASAAAGGAAADAPVAGWYEDPDGEQLRWWDGRDWTDEVQAAPVAAGAEEPALAQPEAPSEKT